MLVRFLLKCLLPMLQILYGAKNGLHAFGNISAESEPIWMKSGTEQCEPNAGVGPGRFWARSSQ